MLIGDVYVGWVSLGCSLSDDCGEYVGVVVVGVFFVFMWEEKWWQGWSFVGVVVEDGFSVWNVFWDNISDVGDGEGVSKGVFVQYILFVYNVCCGSRVVW